MSRAIPVSEARSTLPQLIDRVINGEELTLTRHGVPVAVVVRPDTLRIRRAGDAVSAAERVRALLDDARRTPLNERPGLGAARADELVAAVREHRARRPGRRT